MKQKTYTISIYSENNVGLLSRVSAIFLKRHINIDSLNTSMSEIEDMPSLASEEVYELVRSQMRDELIEHFEKNSVMKSFSRFMWGAMRSPLTFMQASLKGYFPMTMSLSKF